MSTAQSLHVRLYGVQDDFVADDRRYTAFIGGRNSGKTYSGSVKAMLRATQGGLGMIAAPNFPMLEHGAKRQFIDRLNEAGVAYAKTRDGITIPSWHAEVVFVTLESESRVRGPNAEWGWADEVEYVSDRSIWKALKGAIRAGDHPQLFVTSTPKGRRLVWDDWVVNKTDQHAMYKATTFDNIFVDAADYVAGLGYEGVFYEQEITADFVTFEGLVYPAFDRTVHVRSVDCSGWATVLGLDVGTRNPTSLSTYRHAGDRLHKERELYRRGMSTDDILAATEAEYTRSKASHVVVDPSAAGLIASLEQRGVACHKANNDIIVGIGRVASILPTFTLDPECAFTIAEFESYAYPDGGKVERDVPVKANDHALDELRYTVMDLSGDAPAVAAAGVAQRSRWT